MSAPPERLSLDARQALGLPPRPAAQARFTAARRRRARRRRCDRSGSGRRPAPRSGPNDPGSCPPPGRPRDCGTSRLAYPEGPLHAGPAGAQVSRKNPTVSSSMGESCSARRARSRPGSGSEARKAPYKCAASKVTSHRLSTGGSRSSPGNHSWVRGSSRPRPRPARRAPRRPEPERRPERPGSPAPRAVRRTARAPGAAARSAAARITTLRATAYSTAPWDSSRRTTASWPLRRAMDRGVRTSPSGRHAVGGMTTFTFGSAPCSRR